MGKLSKISRKTKNNLIDIIFSLKKGKGLNSIVLLVLLLAVLLVFSLLEDDSPINTPLPQATVIKIIDGDTIDVRLENNLTGRVRLIGVNTPERGDPFFKEASDYTREKLLDNKVYLEFDVAEKDQYQRFLAYVWLTLPTDKDLPTTQEIKTYLFNSQILLAGYAQVMTVPPNVKYQDYFLQYEREAREKNHGLWK